MNIDKILKEFKSKQLSYQQYLELAHVHDNLTAFIAYNSFKDNPNLTVNDILNFKNNHRSNQHRSIRDILSPDDSKLSSYCVTRPSDAACVCYKAVKTKQIEDEKRHIAFVDNYSSIEKENDRLTKEYDEKSKLWNGINIADYIKSINEPVYAYFVTQSASKPPPLPYNKDYYYVFLSDDGPNKNYDAYWTEDYKRFLLDDLKTRYEPHKPVLKELPVEQVVPTNIQCCSTTISNGTTASDILKICNQSVISITEAEANEELKKKEEERRKEEEAKNVADEAKKIADESKKVADEAEANKLFVDQRNKTLIVLFIVFFIIAIVGSFLYVYKSYLNNKVIV